MRLQKLVCKAFDRLKIGMKYQFTNHLITHCLTQWCCICFVGYSIVRIVLCCIYFGNCSESCGCSILCTVYMYENSGVVNHVPLTFHKHTFSTLDLLFQHFKLNKLLFLSSVYVHLYSLLRVNDICFSICFDNDVFFYF